MQDFVATVAKDEPEDGRCRMVSRMLDEKYCQIVIASDDGERILEPCSTRIGAEAFVEFYNSSRLRGTSFARIREISLARFEGYADCQLQ